MKSLLVVVSMGVALWATPSVATEAFTVNVPVEFKNLDPKITAAAIHCKVSQVNSNGTYIDYQPVKTVKVATQGGAYVGTVKVVFQVEDFPAPQRATLSQVNHTHCTFTLVTAAGEFDPHASKPMIGHDIAAPFVWQAEGKFAQ